MDALPLLRGPCRKALRGPWRLLLPSLCREPTLREFSSSALKAERTIRRVSSAFCWMVKPNYQRHFRSAHHGCTGARTSDLDERDWIWRRDC